MGDQRTSVEVYEAKDGWRWRMKAGNGEIIADSAEAYATKSNAERAVTRAFGKPQDNPLGGTMSNPSNPNPQPQPAPQPQPGKPEDPPAT